MREFCANKKESSRLRLTRAVSRPAFNFIRNRRLVETTAEDFFAVIKSGGVFTRHILRCLHNLALGMGWILAPVIPPKRWPKIKKKHRRAITLEEHQRILQNENNAERKLYYEILMPSQSSQASFLCPALRADDTGSGRAAGRRQRGSGCSLSRRHRGGNVLNARDVQNGATPGERHQTSRVGVKSDFERIPQHPRRIVVGNVVALAVRHPDAKRTERGLIHFFFQLSGGEHGTIF